MILKKFFVLDPSPIFRHGLITLIQSFNDCEVEGDADYLKDLNLKHNSYENLFFFLNLDDDTSVILPQIAQIKSFDVRAKIIGFSKFQQREELMLIIKSGINGLLVRSCDPPELANAIAMVHQGQDYFARPVVEMIIQNYAKSNPEIKELIKHNKEQFSKREIEIIKLICQQKTAKEIGKLIFVCEKTVDFHRHKIIEKMNVRNIVGLVVYAIKNELIKIEEI